MLQASRSWRGWILVACLLVPLARAQEAEPAATLVTIRFNQTPVREAISQIAELARADILVAAGIDGVVTANFTAQPVDRVLRVVALALGAELQQVETLYILKPRATEITGAATPPAATEGAGSLLPGELPTGDLPQTPTVPVGAVPAPPPTWLEPAPEPTLPARQPTQRSGMVGPEGNTRPRQTWATTQELYQNLPPGARVTRNGTILLPGGVTVLPSGTVIAPDGTVYQQPQTPVYTVPWGTNLNPGGTLPGQTAGGTLHGNAGGVQFGLGQNSGLTLAPPTITIGGVQLQLPGVQLGGQANGQLPTTMPQVRQPTIYLGAHPPNVHFGQTPPDWYYTTPPGWNLTGPPGTYYPGWSQPRGMGGSLPQAGQTTDPEK